MPTPESDLDPDAFLTTESSSSGHSQPSSRRQSTRETLPTSAAWNSGNSTSQSSATTIYYSRRFYHYHSSSQSDNPLRDPNEHYTERYRRIWDLERAALEHSRVAAIQTLAYCHEVVTGLELARMTATRIGTNTSFHFWTRIYPREVLDPLMRYVVQAIRRIDILFRNTANRLHSMLTQKQMDIRWAATQAQITWEMQVVEEHAYFHCDRRRRKARRIIEKMHDNVQNALNVPVTADKLMNMMRGIFGLDWACDYYPHRLETGHTRVVLPTEPPEQIPHLEYDPRQIPARESVVLVNDRWEAVDAGFRPIGNYELNPSRLL